MNKLNTIIIFLLSFVLLSPVFTTTSYAEIIANTPFKMNPSAPYGMTTPPVIGDLTSTQVEEYFLDYIRNDNQQSLDTVWNVLKNNGFTGYIFLDYISGTNQATVVYLFQSPIDIGRVYSSTTETFQDFIVDIERGGALYKIDFNDSYDSWGRYITYSTYTDVYTSVGYNVELYPGVNVNSIKRGFEFTQPVKTLTYSNSYYTWDGTSYFYEPSSEPDTPTFPTNAEIASAVQKFYNSDIYKNNTNFKDFIVVYSALKNTYAFIGTDITLNQHIYYDGASDYGGFSSSETWWAFHNPRLLDGYLYNNKFYLYFIEGDSDVITNEGVGTIADLENSRYSMNMTIVYSTYDYTVYEHRPPLEGETDNQVTSGTIQGDSYTYDENLDPTDSEYSPLQNYVPSDPTQSILNDVDFDSINQAFEDGKVILNIENASWIFTANNQLVEYFLGFISFLIVLIAISRVLGG